MKAIVCYIPIYTPAIRYAADKLAGSDMQLVSSPGPDVTHVLLPAPTFDTGDKMKGGGNVWLILRDLPKNITIIGGNLHHAALDGYQKIDLLQDPTYLEYNARITAECAIHLAASRLPIILHQCPTLIIGWGRIGKHLAELLQNSGTDLTVSARKESDRTALQMLGIHTCATADIGSQLSHFRLIINTVPAPVITQEQVNLIAQNCVCIDLASQPGMIGEQVIWAKGLPGKDAPESSGSLIAETVLRFIHVRRILP